MMMIGRFVLRQLQQSNKVKHFSTSQFTVSSLSTFAGGLRTSTWQGSALDMNHRSSQHPRHQHHDTSSAAIVNMLKDPSLLTSIANIDSVFLPRGDYFPVYNPARPDSVLALVPNMNQTEVQYAIEAAAKALSSWRDETTASHRSQILTKWSRLLQEHQDDIAKIMTLESGKPLSESYGEISYGGSYLDYYAAEAVRPNSAGGGFIVPTPFSTATDQSPRGHILAWKEAVGVAALICPWNFPLAMMTRKVAPALAVGCTALVKPSNRTPLTTIAMHTLGQRAGLPPDVFQLLNCDHSSSSEVGKELCTNPLVDKISFTGSTTVGKILLKQSSDTVKRMSLELGGNAPFIVFADAKMDQAVDAAMATKFRQAGQTCVCANRFLVHSSIHDEFVERFQTKIKETIRVGDGMDSKTTMGPLITSDAVDKVHATVQEAIEQGAHCVMGGSPMTELGPNFYPPTLLTNVNPTSRVWTTETFGPVAPIIRFEDDDEALRLANDARTGLASYFCTQDLTRVFKFSQRLQAGIVGVNEGIISTCMAPFGGVKESGLGREGSPLGLEEYLETKYVLINP